MIQISLRWYYRFKVALRLEIRLAGLAIVVEVRLTVVLMQTIFIGEQPFATWTIIVGVFVVILQFTKVVEMFIATLAIWMARTLNPMFFQRLPGRKILRAILADVVRRGIGLMLIKSWQRSKRAIASLAVGHDMHDIRRKSYKWVTSGEVFLKSVGNNWRDGAGGYTSWLERFILLQLWRSRKRKVWTQHGLRLEFISW